MRRLYTLLLYLGLPFAALIIAVRAWRERAGLGGWQERAGFGPPRKGGGLWVHAVSVGEVQAAAILIEALRAREATLELTVSCATPSARTRARALLPPEVAVQFAPYDTPGPVRRCLRRLRPAVLVLMETELWPNLLHEAQCCAVPTLIASARLSARSGERYARFPGLLREALQSNVWVAAQTSQDAQRFAALGVAADRAVVAGNIKFDRTVPADVQQRGEALRAAYAPGRPVWVAGSVHPAELPAVLQAQRRVQTVLPTTLLVLAPRHAFRFDEAAAAISAAGLNVQRRSESSTPAHGVAARAAGPACDVLLLDTLGELLDFYAAADVAFVGGSLIAIGGHNLLEPAALARAVIAGPQQFNSPNVARILAERGGLKIVADAPSLAESLVGLLSNPTERTRLGGLALTALQAHRGATGVLLGLIDELRARRERAEPRRP